MNSPIAAQVWVRADNMVGTWIINSVSPKLQGSIIYRDTALEIWTDLRDTFCQGNGTKIFNIQKQIAEIHQGEQSLTHYFNSAQDFMGSIAEFQSISLVYLWTVCV